MNEAKPSRFVLRILRWYCPDHLVEEIEGDLIQKFNQDVVTVGTHRAGQRFILNAIRFFRPGILLRNRFNYIHQRNLMLKNHTRLIVRQFRKHKVVSGVNLIGLTIATTVCLLVAQFVVFENSFERFNKNVDRTFRVNLYNTQNGRYTGTSAATVPALAYVMKQSIPGIESIARVSSRMRGVVANKEMKFEDREDNIVFADPSVIDVLGLDLISGDKSTVLHDPKKILISESIARKYFGNEFVTGRVLDFGFSNNSLEFTPFQIEGVFKDIPSNSHKQFEIVLPPNEQAWSENWSWSDVTTYVVLSPGIQPSSLDDGLASIVKQHHQDAIGDRYLLEPLTAIRLHAMDGSGRATLVNFFILLAAAILLLAWFNYTNLSTARFLERMKEVGIRKLIGASRIQLVTQFVMESFLYNLVSFCFALLLFFLLWPTVNTFLGQDISITLFDDAVACAIVATSIVISTLFSGFYPSLYLSSFKPLSSLKGMVAGIADRSALRKVMVTVQVSVSVALVTAVFAIQRQIEFMRSQDLGISIDQTLIIEEALVTDSKSIEKYETIKNEMLRLSSVKGVTNATSFPGKEIDWHRTDITLGEENASYKYDSRIVAIGTEFLDLFGVKLLTGRNFDPALESDKKAMLISEDASRMFGISSYADAIGKVIFIGSRRFEVIGVVGNYHFRTLQTRIEPVLYMQNYPRGPAFALKVASGKMDETISQLKTKWEEAYAGNVFRYFFLDEFFDRQYHSERQVGKIVTTLAVLALIIACSGLFALSLYSVDRRAKEISIRKVFGASVSNVVVLLSRDLFTLTLIGGLVTIPMMFFSVRQWLKGYAYQMPLNEWLFIVPLFIVGVLVLITISFQTISAAKRNPIENMKYE
ncbi:MAG TPA: ABC transporter permease [Chryseolinea sp.]|nr:ABC transporter permease [Chryseolinea sp.]